MKPMEKALFDILVSRSFRRGDFVLASGVKSNYYIDVRTTSMYPAAAELIGHIFSIRLNLLCPDGVRRRPDAVGGLAVGAVPLVSAICVCSSQTRGPIPGFYVRDAVKGHGAKRLIEGCLEPGQRAVIVEDVATSGGSALRAIQAVREFGCEVVGVIALVDRLAGARELMTANGVPHYESVFTIRDFGVE